jgi:hypothetical protein
LTTKEAKTDISVHKTLWSRDDNGRWAIHGLKGITLKPRPGFKADYFPFESDVELMTSSPPKNLGDFFSSFGSTTYLMKQSILPVVAWPHDARSIRCIGTAFVISCSGYVVTACHVLLDPREAGYGRLKKRDDGAEILDEVVFGVLMPVSPAHGVKAFRIIPFEWGRYWGKWEQSPLIHEHEKLNSLIDVAVCKLPQMPDGSAYQPLNLSLNPFAVGEEAYAIGYATMEDIPVTIVDGRPEIPEFKWDLYVSVGKVVDVFPQNHLSRDIPSPGPSFDFRARIPGKMSGAPIFGAQGSVVRGVVSRSFSGEKHAFGNMIGPAMTLPLADGKSLKSLMDAGNDGITVVRGQGL